MANRTSAPSTPGLWFFRDPTGRDVAGWLDELDPPASRQVCLVPRGVPLLDRRSAVSNTRLLLALNGQDCEVVAAITALRMVEIPDRLLGVKASQLSRAQRLSVWLSVCRLRTSRTIVLVEPFIGVPGAEVSPLARLIREMATPERTILLVSVDPTVGEVCYARPVSDLRNTPW